VSWNYSPLREFSNCRPHPPNSSGRRTEDLGLSSDPVAARLRSPQPSGLEIHHRFFVHNAHDKLWEDELHKLFSVGIAISLSLICVAAAQSMPLGSLEHGQTGLTIPVAGGCGPGFHRGPYGGCRRNGYYGGRYWGGAVVAPGVVVAPRVVPACRRVCGAYGCRTVC